MFCNECGENNRNDRKFCINCGAPLRDYTKPRENLIMPDEIQEKQEQVTNYTSLIKKLNIFMIIFMILAVGCTVASIFFKNKIQIILIVACWVCILIFAILALVKHNIKKKKDNTNENK